MERRTVLKATGLSALALVVGSQARADDITEASFEIVMRFMGAMGSGDMETVGALMADDMVWHNEGDTTLPWVGGSEGKEAIFAFLGVFSSNFETTMWENTDAFASGDTVGVFGKMNGRTTKSGREIGEFTFALRAKVRDGQVVLWHWFEDSFAVSQAYHG
ncbi:nuclear transport factor 2 family protein [uncultured Roseibium sp.]|uniref:nuclear transport factor 2 family protein n=1 Tax=uncultured Roseibium sp. TaxID=1936171 RepID=UPI0026096AEA|nr:nuclear transport factor 2 family protein [uncultured Roseibium sp.]